jgi:hypothetical protein
VKRNVNKRFLLKKNKEKQQVLQRNLPFLYQSPPSFSHSYKKKKIGKEIGKC